jgi:hypothetical protein
MDQATINEWMKDTPKDLPEKIAVQLFGETSHITIPAGMLLGAGLGAGSSYLSYNHPWKQTKDLEERPKTEEERKKLMLLSALAGGTVGGLAGGLAGHITKDQWKDLYKTIIKGEESKTWSDIEDKFREATGQSGYSSGGGRSSAGERSAFEFTLEGSQKLLGVTGSETTKKEVKNKFRDAAMKYHPDRGGSEEMMKRVNNAKDVVFNSHWFEKLAFLFAKDLKKKEKTRFNRVPQAYKDIGSGMTVGGLLSMPALLPLMIAKGSHNENVGLVTRGTEEAGIKSLPVIDSRTFGGSMTNMIPEGRLKTMVQKTNAFYLAHPIKGRGGAIALHPEHHIGVAAHELGHAISAHKAKLAPYANLLIQKGSPLVGTIGAAAAASSENEVAQKAAPVLAAAGFLPTLLEEGMATYRGTKEIARQLGTKRALKSLGVTLPAFATYAALPIGAYMGTKKFLARKKEK